MAIAPQEVLSLLAAGGRSSRFGQDKASYRWEGQSLLARALETVEAVSSETALGLPPHHPDEPESWGALRRAHRVIVDEPAGIGPLGSLNAALRARRGPGQGRPAVAGWVLFLAVDLPLLEPLHLQQLLDAASDDVLAVVATSRDRIQPTCALYHTTLIPNVEQAIQNGQFALRSLFRDLPHARVPLPDRALTNVNRLEDLPHTD